MTVPRGEKHDSELGIWVPTLVLGLPVLLAINCWGTFRMERGVEGQSMTCLADD